MCWTQATRATFLDEVEQCASKPHKVVNFEAPSYARKVGGAALHAVYAQQLPDEMLEELEEAKRQCDDASWYGTCSSYRYAPQDLEIGGYDASDAPQCAQRLEQLASTGVCSPSNGNLLLCWEWLLGLCVMDPLGHARIGLESGETCEQRALKVAETAQASGVAWRRGSCEHHLATTVVAHAGALPRLLLQKWYLARLAEAEKKTLEPLEKSWWIFFLLLVEAVSTPFAESDVSSGRLDTAQRFVAALPELREHLELTEHPRAKDDASLAGVRVLEGQHLSVSQDDKKTNARKFTAAAFAQALEYGKCRLRESEWLRGAFGSENHAKPPHVENDNIVVLDSINLAQFARARFYSVSQLTVYYLE